MLSFVPFGKLGAFCAATIAGIPPIAAAPVAAPATPRNARRSNLVTPPGCVAMAHPRRTGPFTTSGPAGDRPAALHIPAPAPQTEAITAPPIDPGKRSSRTDPDPVKRRAIARWPRCHRSQGAHRGAAMIERLSGVEPTTPGLEV